MPKKIVDFEENRKPTPILKSEMKGVVPATKLAIACFVLLLALSSCTPNKGESASVEENNLEQTQIVMQVEEQMPVEVQMEKNEFTQQVEVKPISQEEFQEKKRYFESEIKKGEFIVNNYIAEYENEYKTDGSKKTPEEIVESKEIANVLRGIERNSLGKYADNFDMSIENISNENMLNRNIIDKYKVILINDEIIYCKKNHVDITKEIKQGEKNVSDSISKFKTIKDTDGKVQTSDEQKLDACSIAFIETLLTDIADKISLYDNSSDKCEIESFFDTKSVSIILNEEKCLWSSSFDSDKQTWIDETNKYQEEINKKALSKKYNKTIENAKSDLAKKKYLEIIQRSQQTEPELEQ